MNGIVAGVRRFKWNLGRLLPEKDITCTTRNGLLAFSSHDGVIARRLYSTRQWAWEEIDRFSSLLIREGLLVDEGPNETLINVGANIGSVMIPLMDRLKFQNGLGFEPCPKTFNYLKTNIDQNGLSEQVQLFPMGLSNCDRVAEFECSPTNSGDHRVRMKAAQASCPARYSEHLRSVIEVPLSSLDAVLAEAKIELCPKSLLWVDIQGHEGHFFDGARQTLSQKIPVVTELWPYGIARAGYNRDSFCGTVSELFEEFYYWSGRQWEKEPIGKLSGLYGNFESKKSCVDILLH